MKRISILCSITILLSIPFISKAQWIDSLWVIPSNPTTTDTIYFYAVCYFSSGGCSQSTDTFFVNPPVISAYSLHCLGPLTYICQDTDIFVINPLPAGSYTFTYQADAGTGPSPCTPGIVPGPVDSVIVHVNNPSGIPYQPLHGVEIQVVPGLETGTFRIIIPSVFLNGPPVEFKVYNQSGQLADVFRCNRIITEIDLSFLEAGIYFIRSSGNGISHRGFKVIIP